MTTTETRRQRLEAAAAQGAADYQASTYDPFARIPGAYDEEPVTTPPAASNMPPVRTLTPVTDCPACVWNDFGATGLDRDFAREWSHALHAAGTQAVQEPLIRAWRKRGYLAELVCHHAHQRAEEIAVPDVVCHAVWQEAVDAVDGDELLARADLDREHAAWGDR